MRPVTRVLVLGATGFVGSHALEALAARGDTQGVAVCRDRSRLPRGFAGEVIEGDLRDEAFLRELFMEGDVVCNAFAWTSLFGHAEASRIHYLEPTLKLIDLAREAGVSRFLNVSTTSAAAPETSADAMSPGIPRAYWPHLCNVIEIENRLRSLSSPTFTVINLRLGIFSGARYALGLLPILVPRLKTHLVPWVAGGKTGLPIVDGRDIGQAFAKAATVQGVTGYESVNIVGPSVPTAREVIETICAQGYPRPHFSVPFPLAFAFAGLMEAIDPIVPWEPLVTRSIIHLLRETGADNERAKQLLDYTPVHDWRDAVSIQLEEMSQRQLKPMSMARPVS